MAPRFAPLSLCGHETATATGKLAVATAEIGGPSRRSCRRVSVKNGAVGAFAYEVIVGEKFLEKLELSGRRFRPSLESADLRFQILL